MGYHWSCRSIKLDDQQVLSAEAADRHGQWLQSSLPLNLLLGNIDGKFEWGKQNFGGSARSIRLEDGGEFLAAELGASRGWVAARVRLDDLITNDNGVLRAQLPVVVNYPTEEAPVVIDKILEQLKANADLAVTMLDAEEEETKAFVIHPQHQAVSGPESVGSFPVLKVSRLETVEDLTTKIEALPNTVNNPEWRLPTDGPGQLQAFTRDATAGELNAGNATVLGPTDSADTSFVQPNFRSFEKGFSLSGKAGIKGFGGIGNPQMDLGGMLHF